MPVRRDYRSELIIVACGYDANALDLLARMQLSSGSFAAMPRRVRQLGDELCNSRLVLVHEGGYSEAYVPFCGHKTIEALANVATDVEDPLQAFIDQQQPSGEVVSWLQDHVRSLTDQLLS